MFMSDLYNDGYKNKMVANHLLEDGLYCFIMLHFKKLWGEYNWGIRVITIQGRCGGGI